MSSTGQLESKVEILNRRSVEEQNKELCKHEKQQHQQQQRQTSPLYTYKLYTNEQKLLEHESDNENSLSAFDKILPSEMQSIQMLESVNVTSVEKHHHNRHYSINDKSDLEEMWFSNLEEHAYAEEHSHPPVNYNEHTLLLSHITTLTNNVHWLKEELRETQRQLLQSWGSYITQQEEMKILQTRIDDLERKMEEQRSHVSSSNITSQAKRVNNTKMLYGQQHTNNSTIIQNRNNKTKQLNTMTQMRCENNKNIISKNNINNCSCFVTKLRNGVSGFDVYGRSLAHKRSHTNKKNAIDSSSNNHYSRMQNAKFESKCTCEKGKTNRYNVYLEEVCSNRIQNNNNDKNYENSSKVMKVSEQTIAKKRIITSPELLETEDHNCKHLLESEEQQCWQEEEKQEQQQYNNPETSNGTTDRERSNIQDSSVPSDGSNTVWVSSIRRVSSAYIEHNNLSSFTNGFFVTCDENDSQGELRQVIGPHVKYISNNHNNEMEKNNKRIQLDELKKEEEKYYEEGRKSTSPFLIAVDSNDGNSIFLEQQHCECEKIARETSSKLEGKILQEMEINSTIISAADAQRACSKMEPLTNITNMLPKCSSCLNTKMCTVYDKWNNTFHCQRIVDLKSKINNNKSDKYLCDMKKHDSENLHATLPLLHHTKSVMFDTTRH